MLKHGARVRQRRLWSGCVPRSSLILNLVSPSFSKCLIKFKTPCALSFILVVGLDKEGLSHAKVKDLFSHTFSGFHDLKIQTRSLNGERRFTAWEWIVTCKAGLGADGVMVEKNKATAKRIVGCTLMWWNEHDKIIRNHEYMQIKEDE